MLNCEARGGCGICRVHFLCRIMLADPQNTSHAPMHELNWAPGQPQDCHCTVEQTAELGALYLLGVAGSTAEPVGSGGKCDAFSVLLAIAALVAVWCVRYPSSCGAQVHPQLPSQKQLALSPSPYLSRNGPLSLSLSLFLSLPLSLSVCLSFLSFLVLILHGLLGAFLCGRALVARVFALPLTRTSTTTPILPLPRVGMVYRQAPCPESHTRHQLGSSCSTMAAGMRPWHGLDVLSKCLICY